MYDEMWEPLKHYWYPWAGGECPVEKTAFVEVLYGNGDHSAALGYTLYWPWREQIVHRSNIVAYRLLYHVNL